MGDEREHVERAPNGRRQSDRNRGRRLELLEELLDVSNAQPWPMSACPVCGAHVLADMRTRHTNYHLQQDQQTKV